MVSKRTQKKGTETEAEINTQNFTREEPVLGHIFSNGRQHLISVHVQILLMKKGSLGKNHTICSRPPNRPPSAINVLALIVFL